MWGVTNHAEFAKDNRLVNNDSDSEENVIPEIPVLDVSCGCPLVAYICLLLD